MSGQSRGHFSVGVYHAKTEANVGTLWRSAHIFGASMIFTVGRRYVGHASDTTKAWKSVPLIAFDSLDDLTRHLPRDCPLVGVELLDDAEPLNGYRHLERSTYLLGAEDSGLPPEVLDRCSRVIRLPGRISMNVAMAGTIVLHHRWAQFHEDA